MPRRQPETIRPSLADALDRARRAFPGATEGLEKSLVLAFAHGEIPTWARFPDRAKTFNISGVLLDVPYTIDPYYWQLAKLEDIDWQESRCTFFVPTMFDPRLVPDVAVDVTVSLPHLLRWLERGKEAAKASRRRTPPSAKQVETPGPVVYGTRLRRAEASRYLKEIWGIERTPATLAKLATIGGGPPFELANRVPLYPKDELDRWAQSILSPLKSSTSDTGK